VARHTYPRPERHHEVAAQNILARHAAATGTPVTLPVPIDMIVESTYGLTVLWDDIPEPAESMILGALFPSEQRIVINTRHLDLLERVMGPARFTLAHELAHWIYDADDPNQMAFALDEASPTEQYCYDRAAAGLAENARLREMNANKLASHVLLPEQLVRAVAIGEVLDDFAATARAWGVSQQTLRIRLETLGLIDPAAADRLPGW
jgi:Zn-dependent peptidase ImmA (M78 family)